MAIFQSIYILLITLGCLLYSFLPSADILKLKKKWALFVLKVLRIKLEMKGRPPVNGPCILLGNHISYIDIVALMASNPKTAFLAKKEIQSWPIIGPTADRVDTLYVDRESRKDKDMVRRKISDQLLEKKSQLVVFPSGTTTLAEEIVWKKGMFEVAKGSVIPIHLFAVTYSHRDECAYVGEDTMLSQIKRMSAVSNKIVTVNWLGEFSSSSSTEQMAVEAQSIVIQNLK